MKQVILFILFGLLSSLVAQANVGKVIRLKGTAKIKITKGDEAWRALNQGDTVSDLSTIITEKKSFLSIEFPQRVTINIGAESSYTVDIGNGGKPASYHLLVGKMRAIINKKLSPEEKIKFNNKAVALGVRGTEFLQNAYLVNNKATSDVALLKGKLAVDPSGSSQVKPFELNAGQSFNTSELALNGMSAVKKIPSDILNQLSDPANFMNNIQSASGTFSSVGMAAASGLLAAGALLNAAGGLASSDSTLDSSEDSLDRKEDKKKDQKPIDTAKKDEELDKDKIMNQGIEKSKTKVLGLIDFKYVIKDEPLDIRESLLRRKKDLKDNKCYFWIYRQIGGYGKKERFKRERDCDEYDYDL